MPKSRGPYSPEFRQRIVELVRKGRTPEELGRQFEPSAQCIRNWVRQADRDEGHRQDGLTTAEQNEVRRLRRENRALDQPADDVRGGDMDLLHDGGFAGGRKEQVIAERRHRAAVAAAETEGHEAKTARGLEGPQDIGGMA